MNDMLVGHRCRRRRCRPGRRGRLGRRGGEERRGMSGKKERVTDDAGGGVTPLLSRHKVFCFVCLRLRLRLLAVPSSRPGLRPQWGLVLNWLQAVQSL